MTYKCPKGHVSTDSDYCSECGALIGDSKLTQAETAGSGSIDKLNNASLAGSETCPDCGTPRVGDARFCEVCRHDFQENKTGVAEAIVASQKEIKDKEVVNKPDKAKSSDFDNAVQSADLKSDKASNSIIMEKENVISMEKLNVLISVDKDKALSCDIETSIKPDSIERVFPLDLNENLVGRRSASKGIYPEIEINDPGVSHRHLKLSKESDGSFTVLELGSANGTELNGVQLMPGVKTALKAGDKLAIGIWTILRIETR